MQERKRPMETVSRSSDDDEEFGKRDGSSSHKGCSFLFFHFLFDFLEVLFVPFFLFYVDFFFLNWF